MEGNVKHVVKQGSKLDGKNGLPSFTSACRSTASRSSKSYKGRNGHPT